MRLHSATSLHRSERLGLGVDGAGRVVESESVKLRHLFGYSRVCRASKLLLDGPLEHLYRYAIHTTMIRSFRHKGLELFFRTGSRKGVLPAHAPRLRLQLARLDGARCPQDMDYH